MRRILWTLATLLAIFVSSPAYAGSDWNQAKQDIIRRVPLHGRPGNRLDMEQPATRAEAGAMALRQGDAAFSKSVQYVDGRLQRLGIARATAGSTGSTANAGNSGTEWPWFWPLLAFLAFLAFLAIVVLALSGRGSVHWLEERRQRQEATRDPIRVVGRQAGRQAAAGQRPATTTTYSQTGEERQVATNGQMDKIEQRLGAVEQTQASQGRRLGEAEERLGETINVVNAHGRLHQEYDRIFAEAAQRQQALAEQIENFLLGEAAPAASPQPAAA